VSEKEGQIFAECGVKGWTRRNAVGRLKGRRDVRSGEMGRKRKEKSKSRPAVGPEQYFDTINAIFRYK
jgi:hypothetical protein